MHTRTKGLIAAACVTAALMSLLRLHVPAAAQGDDLGVLYEVTVEIGNELAPPAPGSG